MNTRIKQIVEYSGLSQSQFAAAMGWKPQYLTSIIQGKGLGLKPISSLLQRFEEISARWLILGEGPMIERPFDPIKEHIRRLLDLERYLVVMTPLEQQQVSRGNLEFDHLTIERWETLLAERNAQIEARFQAAYDRQNR